MTLILQRFQLGLHWPTRDPFLFCAHHHDAYPPANDRLGPDVDLSGRSLGQDFAGRDGWNMYHGEQVPGFPGHPHRGFETVTMVRQGYVDHADSLGAAGRYGPGDVQWMTAGRGIQHSEMFPLLHRDRDNPLELFQIWLNLPARNKLVEPHFTMFWQQAVPVHQVEVSEGGKTRIEVIAGESGAVRALPPPPDSWAADSDSAVSILHVEAESGATWELPAADAGLSRMLYFYAGDTAQLLDLQGQQGGQETLEAGTGLQLRPDASLRLKMGGRPGRFLFLQGRPLNEPVAQYGPFVMNSREELQQAFQDYQQTGFGGWPWPRQDQVHGNEARRFARFADGRSETPPVTD